MMQRACHAVRLGSAGKVWIVDPVDVAGLDERIAGLAAAGQVAGVLQLLDRHDRDCAAFADRHGAPLHRLPFDGIEGTGLEPIQVIRNRAWKEVAIWSESDRALIVPEAVGTAPYFRAGDEQVGIHPMLRLLPPRGLARLRARAPAHRPRHRHARPRHRRRARRRARRLTAADPAGAVSIVRRR